MSNQISQPPLRISSKAEGDPDEHEQLEPPTILRTSTVPAIQDTSEIRLADSGIHLLVNLGVEGKDEAEEQDSSLTKDETKLDTKREADADMSESKNTTPILIVEDTIELAEVIQATLEGMGLKAVYETHGKTGLERLRELNPDLVLMDIGLPDITGWKMLDYIKEHYAGKETDMPMIIVITAFSDPANRLIGKLQNIHSYLVKPFTPDQVEHLVDMALRGERPADPSIGGEAFPQS
jgi:CheY-like chemotaxis protein